LAENNLSFTRAGEEVLLPIKPWSTLLLLAQHAPDTLSKAELMDAVWQGRNVTGACDLVIASLLYVCKHRCSHTKSSRWVRTQHYFCDLTKLALR
jgi:DNA-binding winged helix-turn-helix (wHTH) protein